MLRSDHISEPTFSLEVGINVLNLSAARLGFFRDTEGSKPLNRGNT